MNSSTRTVDPSTLQSLWNRYLKSREVTLRNRLVEQYRDLVHMQSARLAQKLPAQVSFDEICSAGYDGLIEAVEAFDPKHKAKFETFCQRRIHGAVMDWLRELDVQSRTVRSFEKARTQLKEVLDSELGRPPTDDELARDMKMTKGRYRELTRLSRVGHEVHLSAVQADEEGGRRSGGGWDIQDRSTQDPSERAARKMFIEYMTRGLNKEEKLALVLYYYEGLTMAEIGQVLDLSESRVSQIHKDVIERLRRRLYRDEVAEMVA